VFMPGINQLLDETGRFTSPDLEKRLANQAAGFVAFVEILRAKRLQP